MSDPETNHPFDAETWEQLPSLLAHLPEPVALVVWGDASFSRNEREAVRLCQALADRFNTIAFHTRPRRINFQYYPVIGVMGDTGDDEWHEFGVRIIGLPDGYQMTSFITAVQSVSFRGQTLEPKTRIQLSRLSQEVRIEVMTDADNEVGAIMAQRAFNMAVVNAHVRSFLVMADQFPEAVMRYSIQKVPHTVINGRVHIEGVVDEEALLQHIAQAVKTEQKS